MTTPSIIFSDGHKMPLIGLGTYAVKGVEGIESTKYAIDVGYRHIDTAAMYGNEKQIGEAIVDKIKNGTIEREDIFVTTKLACNAHKENQVVPACKKSLENLGLDYIDLYLIHTPYAFKEGNELTNKDSEIISNTDYLETWRGMEECKREGLAYSIGISNFNSEQITRLLTEAEIKPVNNQIEVSINLNQKNLIAFCRKHDITVTGYSPLGKPGNRLGIENSFEHPTIQALSTKYGKTAAQIALRFVLQMGAVPIPKSITRSRIKENYEIFDFDLTKEEMHSIQLIGTGKRVAPLTIARESMYYPFNIPF